MDSFVILVLANMVILIGLATLLHIQFGLTGIVNFGVVGFWGIGMYGFGIMLVEYGIPYLLALLLATLIVALVALLVGWIVLDLDEQAALVSTLAFATIVFYLVTTEKWLTRGVVGFGTVPYPFDFGRDTEFVFLVVLAGLSALVLLYAYRIQSQPYGRTLRSIRDNEPLASSLGKPTFRQKLVIFVVTSTAMGLFGALSGSINQFLVPRMVGPGVTFTVWIAVILGGRKVSLGGLVGILATVGVFDLLLEVYGRDLVRTVIGPGAGQVMPNLKLMVYGVVLVIILMFRPQGILGGRRDG